MEELKDSEKITPQQRNKNIIKKYLMLREKIIEHYYKGCKILNTVKFIVAAIFIAFTIIGVIVSNHTGNKMFWLILWIIVIFLNVGVFSITDYCKYLVKEKVIPYLNNDNQIEFDELELFADHDDEEDEEED